MTTGIVFGMAIGMCFEKSSKDDENEDEENEDSNN